MKVGTDGVLLGGWTSLEHNPDSILDIGTGTGLIALMLAQRSAAETIDAVEIDESAYEQCVENFEASPWADRLFCYHAGLDEFVNEWDDTYDLIVSNPPFFRPSKNVSETGASLRNNRLDKISDVATSPKQPTEIFGKEAAQKKTELGGLDGKDAKISSREVARFYDSLPFDALLEGVSTLLAKDGGFATIIPYGDEQRFLRLAFEHGLHPQKMTRVKGNPTSKIKRSLLEFGFTETKVDANDLVIERKRHKYTPEYRALTRDFYLKM